MLNTPQQTKWTLAFPYQKEDRQLRQKTHGVKLSPKRLASAGRRIGGVGRGRSTRAERGIEFLYGELDCSALGRRPRVSKVSGDAARTGADVVPGCSERQRIGVSI